VARDPIPTWFFVVTIVHRDGRYLLLKEKKHRGWYFPAGRVEAGESLADAALRETREETGVDVVLEGLLRFEHGPTTQGVRVRVFFLARPLPGSDPRQTRDNDGAAMLTLDEIRALELRGPDVLPCLEFHAAGGRVLPLDALTTEDAPWRSGRG
jgi:8-oxo-dGTP pyrophosphatase MutT (NUDIX family)